MKKDTSVVLAILVAGLATPAAAQPDPATMVMMCDGNGDDAVTQKEWEACGAPTAYPADKDMNKDAKVTVDEMAGTQPSSDEPPAKPQ